MPMCTGTCCAKQTANRILRNERTVFATFWALKSGSAGSMAPATASSSASSRSPGAASLDSAHTVFDSACDGRDPPGWPQKQRVWYVLFSTLCLTLCNFRAKCILTCRLAPAIP